MYKTPTNRDIGAMLNSIADALEIKGTDEYRVRAFRNGARSVETLDLEVADAVARGRLDLLPGIGKTLGAVIDEFVRSAASKELEKAREGLPPGLFDLLELRGLGPKTVGKLFKELKIEEMEGLERAALAGTLRTLPGMGSKKEAGLLAEIAKHRDRRGKRLLGEALPLARHQMDELLRVGGVVFATPAGALRRGAPVVEAIELLVAAHAPTPVLEKFAGLCTVVDRGESTAAGRTADGAPIALTVCRPEAFGAALLLATGSEVHLDRLRQIAAQKGLRLDGEPGVGFANEESIYSALGMQFVPPELREDGSEVDAALRGKLPRLVEAADIRGDLHCHTRWSDGAHSIAEMAHAARDLGRGYLAISDHSVSLAVAHGLDPARLAEQAAAISKAGDELDRMRILRGTEVDILADGTLDYANEILAGLEWVSAAVHTSFKQPTDRMTRRLVAAIQNPHVDAIAHPTGRLLNSRDGYEFDVDAVFQAAAQAGTALEINAQPDRLDLSEDLSKKAAAMGIPIVINTDAHSRETLELMVLGVTVARRAWLTRDNVLNARDLDGLEAWRAERRNRASG